MDERRAGQQEGAGKPVCLILSYLIAGLNASMHDEVPELLPKALQALEAAFPGSLTRMVDASGLQAEMFEHVSGLALPVEKTPDDNIVPINLWKSSI